MFYRNKAREPAWGEIDMRAKRRNKRINQRNSFLRDLQKKIAMAVFCFGTFVAPVQATVADTALPVEDWPVARARSSKAISETSVEPL